MQRGAFTFAECLVACAILAIVVLGMASVLVSAHASSSYSLHSMRAVHLAEEMAERTLAVPYASIASFNGRNESPGQLKDIAGSLYPYNYQVFSRQVATQVQGQAVAPLGGTVNGTLVTVTVTDQKGQSWVATRFIPES